MSLVSQPNSTTASVASDFPVNSQQFDLLNMAEVKIDPQWALRIPANLAERRQVLPFANQNGSVLVACKSTLDEQSLQAVSRYITEPLLPIAAEADSLGRAIGRIFHDAIRWNGNRSEPIRVQISGGQPVDPDGENIVALGDEIFHAALIRGATDIHIAPGPSCVYVRIRAEGRLEEYRRLPNSVHNALVSRLKVLSGMDIAEKRAPQDGRFTIKSEFDSEVDVRSATIPTKHGERITLRLLATQTHDLTLENLGMRARDQSSFEHAIYRPNGLVLLTGPTGCGKSTTLYAALRNIQERDSKNIITIEDPVEYVIDGISQVEIDTNDKVSFRKALRSLLRHDPDVLMIGEIRDEETAGTAIKAAMTGHLVFSTLHANSSVAAVSRLADMDVKPFLIGSVTRIVVAQRLVRRLCSHCKVESEMSSKQATAFDRQNLTGMPVFEPTGCKYCANTGFAGRLGLFELIPFDQELARVVASQTDEAFLEQALCERGFKTLLDDGLEKVFAGETTLEQVASVISPY